MSRHATAMDADSYWRQFVYPFYFDEKGDQIAGTIRRLIEPARTDKDPAPAFEIQTRRGRAFIVVARQARLRAELGKLAPAVGDEIKIVYQGEAEKAAPGFNPAKEFTVTIARQGSRPGVGTEAVSGEVADSENDPRAGKTPA